MKISCHIKRIQVRFQHGRSFSSFFFLKGNFHFSSINIKKYFNFVVQFLIYFKLKIFFSSFSLPNSLNYSLWNHSNRIKHMNNSQMMHLNFIKELISFNFTILVLRHKTLEFYIGKAFLIND